MDIDYFKSINDQYGHAAGDSVLIQFVNLVQSVIRKDVDWLARIGGEEFVVVLPHTKFGDAHYCAERIRAATEGYSFTHENNIIKVSCSVGAASAGEKQGNVSAEQLLIKADEALYKAKTSGRNRVEYSVPENS